MAAAERRAEVLKLKHGRDRTPRHKKDSSPSTFRTDIPIPINAVFFDDDPEEFVFGLAEEDHEPVRQ